MFEDKIHNRLVIVEALGVVIAACERYLEPLPSLFRGTAEAHTVHVVANRQVRLGRGVGGLAV